MDIITDIKGFFMGMLLGLISCVVFAGCTALTARLMYQSIINTSEGGTYIPEDDTCIVQLNTPLKERAALEFCHQRHLSYQR